MYPSRDTHRWPGAWNVGRTSVLCLSLLGAGVGCSRATSSPTDQAPRALSAQVVISPDSGAPPSTITVELARTPEEHARGLMFRKALPEDTGMLFLFDHAELRRFWMKNTYIPLDMIFLDEGRRIVGIEEQTVPHDETARGPDEPAQYVLEVPGGYSRRHGIGKGARAEFVHVP